MGTTLVVNETAQTIKVVADDRVLLEDTAPGEVLTVATTGPQGPTGSAATLSVGSVTTVANGVGSSVSNSGTLTAAVLDFILEAGPAVNATVVHTQSSSASTWTVNHNLGRYPSVDVIDSAGTQVIGDIQHTSINQAVLTFDNPFAGKAIII